LLEGKHANLADCFFSLAQLGAAIKKISELEHKMFRYHCIKSFNKRFKEFDFDEHLLAYYLHSGYQGKHFFKIKFLFIFLLNTYN